VANQKSAELAESGVGAFDDPSAFVASEFSAILVAPVLTVLAVRHDELDATLGEPLTQRVGVVGSVGDHPFRLLSRAALGARNLDFGERGFRKRNFCRRGTFKPNSQRKTATVDQYHPLRALATLGFTDRGAPFFAGAKVPSRNVSSHFSRPSPSRHTSCSSHCFSRRQQVTGEGYLSGKNRHAAPVCNTHRMPSRQTRLDAHRRPRLSLRRFGAGSSGSINSHCFSLNNSKRFLLMREVHQTACPTQKSTA
jgi:hypothetical protein